jgi:hypothetical protein
VKVLRDVVLLVALAVVVVALLSLLVVFVSIEVSA